MTACQILSTVGEELMNELTALSVRGEADRAMTRGKSSSEIYSHCRWITGRREYYQMLVMSDSLGVEADAEPPEECGVVPLEAAGAHQTGAGGECVDQLLDLLLMMARPTVITLACVEQDRTSVGVDHAGRL